MTDKHPLTDDIAQSIQVSTKLEFPFGIGEVMFTFNDMRAAYDLAVEQITEQWKEIWNSERSHIQVIREFDKRLEAMRPQQQGES